MDSTAGAKSSRQRRSGQWAATISAPLSAACAARPGRRGSGRKTFLDQSLRLLEIPEDCRQTIGLHAPASGARRTLQHRQPQPDGGQVIVHFMKSSRIASAGGIAAAVRGALPRRGWLARRSRL
jgi:hypothetical protein